MFSSPRYISAAVAADYLVNISSAVAGCNPDRFFTVVGSVGVYGGVANFYKGMDPVAGVRAGLQGRFRVSDNLDIFVEPQGLLLKSPTITGSTISPQVRVMAGLSYKLGHTPASLEAAEAAGKILRRCPMRACAVDRCKPPDEVLFCLFLQGRTSLCQKKSGIPLANKCQGYL